MLFFLIPGGDAKKTKKIDSNTSLQKKKLPKESLRKQK